MQVDVLVVGAGFAGAVCARELAEAGFHVLIVDRRHHVGGNAHDCHDAHGVLIHPFGPHIFHTNSERVFAYLSRFTEWRPYEHRVLAEVDGKLLPIPINRTTINRLYSLNLSEQGIADHLDAVRIRRTPIQTSEDVVLNSVGEDLCDRFFRGYTRKQWGLELSQLSPGVASRIPTRTTDDDRYFSDRYQYMPLHGYTELFRRMLDHPGITIRTGTTHTQALAEGIAPIHLIYSGPIDAYFDYRHGRLPYRSLHFEHIHLPETETHQAVGTVNYPNTHDYTRITEFKHLTGQNSTGTSIAREYPTAEGDPYYPIPRPENEQIYQRYRQLADRCEDVTFVGRLAQYRYYNMDQVVGAALTESCKVIAKLKARTT